MDALGEGEALVRGMRFVTNISIKLVGELDYYAAKKFRPTQFLDIRKALLDASESSWAAVLKLQQSLSPCIQELNNLSHILDSLATKKKAAFPLTWRFRARFCYDKGCKTLRQTVDCAQIRLHVAHDPELRNAFENAGLRYNRVRELCEKHRKSLKSSELLQRACSVAVAILYSCARAGDVGLPGINSALQVLIDYCDKKKGEWKGRMQANKLFLDTTVEEAKMLQQLNSNMLEAVPHGTDQKGLDSLCELVKEAHSNWRKLSALVRDRRAHEHHCERLHQLRRSCSALAEQSEAACDAFRMRSQPM